MCFNIVFILFFSTAADLKVIIDDNNYILALKMCIQNINHYRNIKKKLVTDTVRLGQLRHKPYTGRWSNTFLKYCM